MDQRVTFILHHGGNLLRKEDGKLKHVRGEIEYVTRVSSLVKLQLNRITITRSVVCATRVISQ